MPGLSCFLVSPPWRVLHARRQVMEVNQVHLVTAAVACDWQQILHALEARFAGQIVAHVGHANWHNRIHDNRALFHPVTTTHLYLRSRPDANATGDVAAPDPLAEAFGKHHMEPQSERIGCCISHNVRSTSESPEGAKPKSPGQGPG